MQSFINMRGDTIRVGDFVLYATKSMSMAGLCLVRGITTKSVLLLNFTSRKNDLDVFKEHTHYSQFLTLIPDGTDIEVFLGKHLRKYKADILAFQKQFREDMIKEQF